jgi:hypothetical protein
MPYIKSVSPIITDKRSLNIQMSPEGQSCQTIAILSISKPRYQIAFDNLTDP